MLIGFLHRGGLEQWSYAVMADIAAQGVDVMRFTSQDVDLSRRLILGERWQNGRWTKALCRYPDAVRNFEFRDEAVDKVLTVLPYSLGRHLRKDEQLTLLSKLPQVSAFIPVTLDLDGAVDVLALVRQWGGAILKPARGRLGQGIVFIRLTDPNFELEVDGSRRTVTQVELQAFLTGFAERAGRSYVVQQFAASTGPQGRYFNVRIIMQKGGDGDWHPCGFPLSLLARPGSVVANREAGAVNISLKAILSQRFGAEAPGVLEGLFSSAVLISRALDDAIAQQADELALDMAVDSMGAPWLHETNWRGGFWMLQEDIGLYRFGGANAVRLGLRHQFGIDPDIAKASQIYSKRGAPYADSTGTRGRFDENFTLGAALVQRSDHSAALVAQLLTGGVKWLSVSSSASFGEAQKALGRSLEVMSEQAPQLAQPQLIVRVGSVQHDPQDPRAPQRWIDQELVANGLISAQDAALGSTLASGFLGRSVQQSLTDLGVESVALVLLEGLERHIQQVYSPAESTADFAQWLEACATFAQFQAVGKLACWGVAVPLEWLINHIQLLSTWLQAAEATGNPPTWLGVDVLATSTRPDLSGLETLCARFSLKPLVNVLPLPPRSKPWQESHRLFPTLVIRELVDRYCTSEALLLAPIANAADVEDFFSLQPSLSNEVNPMTPDVSANAKLPKAVSQALQTFAQFDPRQLFRFFVDGRFHKKYQGWTGYEANEAGSVKGILDAYSLMLDKFDLSGGLTSGYIRELHIACMSGVSTKNRKSTPGEVRFLESGINLYHGKSTLASVAELLEQRRGDGNFIFHHPDYQRTAEAFSAEEILRIIQKEGRVRYRAWYPNLTEQQQQTLIQPRSLGEFYTVKHLVQKCFAERTDQIVESYNTEIAAAQSPQTQLLAISRVVRDLELLHPFPDGNGRTFVAVLMNHLLLAHGFLPAILWDPNIDAELSVQEFADEIQTGIANTQMLLKDPDTRLYDYSIGDADAADVKAFAKLSQGFVSRLHTLAYGPECEKEDTTGQTIYLALTPNRLVVSTGGFWTRADAQLLSTLRFASVSLGGMNAPQQLLFCRSLKAWKEAGKDPIQELQREIDRGAVAIVLDDADVAQRLSVPTLLVPDVDDALFAAGSAVRQQVNCKAIAVVGTANTALTRELMAQAAKSQLQLHVGAHEPAKTPQVMASLASLRRTDQLELQEVQTGARVNVARHRLRAIAPDICLFSSAENSEQLDTDTYSEVIKTLAACADGLRPGGLCIVNADSTPSDVLRQEIRRRGEVGIQTFGSHEKNEGRLLSAQFDTRSKVWAVSANILGKVVNYQVSGDKAPLMSVGVLLALENLGVSIEAVADGVWQ
jgi:hypothetical protein